MGSLVERTMRASLRYFRTARNPRGRSPGEQPLRASGWEEEDEEEEGVHTLKHSRDPRGRAGAGGGEGEAEGGRGLSPDVPPDEASEVGEQGCGGGASATGRVSFRLNTRALISACGAVLGGSSAACLADASSSHTCRPRAPCSSPPWGPSPCSSWSRLLALSDDQSGDWVWDDSL